MCLLIYQVVVVELLLADVVARVMDRDLASISSSPVSVHLFNNEGKNYV